MPGWPSANKVEATSPPDITSQEVTGSACGSSNIQA